MKYTYLIVLYLFISGCSIEIRQQKNIDFTAEEVRQMGCLGGYKKVNGKYVEPNINELTPESKKLYLECINSK